MKKKIKEAKIKRGKYDSEVYVKYDESNEYEYLFSYYYDEISFTEDEFIGLTKDEAFDLKFKKDKAYLQS